MNPIPFIPFINERLRAQIKGWRDVNQNSVVGCAACAANRQIKDMLAFDAVNDGKPIIALFCTTKCFLTAIPPECCGRA